MKNDQPPNRQNYEISKNRPARGGFCVDTCKRAMLNKRREMFWHKHDEKSFLEVAIAFILVGAAIFAYGFVGWLINVAQSQTIMALPSAKIVGGVVIMALGYIHLELDLLRRK